VVAVEGGRSFTAETHDHDCRTPVLVLHLLGHLLDRLQQLCRAGLTAPWTETLESCAQFGAVVREIDKLLRLHNDRVQTDLGVPEQLLHETAGAELKGARSLVGDEERDAQRNLRRR